MGPPSYCGPSLTETSLCGVRNIGDNGRRHLGADCLSAEGIPRILFNSSLWNCSSIPDGKPRSAGARHIHGGRQFSAKCQFWRHELCGGAGAVLRQGVQPGVQTGTSAPAAADAGVAIHSHPGTHLSDSHRSTWHSHLQARSLGHRRTGLLLIWSRLQLKCDGTRWRTGEEVKGKLANGVVNKYSSHYLGSWRL